MTVELTSPVEGKQPGDPYSGPNEAFYLAEGYAKRKGYKGPGVSNTGPASIKDATKHPQLAENAPANEDNETAVTSDLPFGGTNDGVEVKRVGDQSVFALPVPAPAEAPVKEEAPAEK